MARPRSVLLTPTEVKIAMKENREAIRTATAVSRTSRKEIEDLARDIRLKMLALDKAQKAKKKADAEVDKAKAELEAIQAQLDGDTPCVEPQSSASLDPLEAGKTQSQTSFWPSVADTDTPLPTPSEQC